MRRARQETRGVTRQVAPDVEPGQYGHASRLDRSGITDPVLFGSHDYSREELVAEMGAAFLWGETGIENATLDSSAAYVAGWLKRLRGDSRASRGVAIALPRTLNSEPITSPWAYDFNERGCPRATGSQTIVEATKLRREAMRQMKKRDGTACLAHLARADELDPGGANRATARTRAVCTLLAGRCDAGKALLRRHYHDSTGRDTEAIEAGVAGEADAGWCCASGRCLCAIR